MSKKRRVKVMADKSNGGQGHEPHIHHMGTFSVEDLIGSIVRDRAQEEDETDKIVDTAAHAGSQAIWLVLRDEYQTLNERCHTLDSMLGSEGMTFEQAAQGYALHVIAEDDAARLARYGQDKKSRREFEAQVFEHKAMISRWAGALSDTLEIDEKIAAEKSKKS